MTRYLLDANAVIALLNDAASKPAQRARREKPRDTAISATVYTVPSYAKQLD